MNAAHDGYNFAYLDEQTKRMIRRAVLKAVAIPGHQVPFGSRPIRDWRQRFLTDLRRLQGGEAE